MTTVLYFTVWAHRMFMNSLCAFFRSLLGVTVLLNTAWGQSVSDNVMGITNEAAGILRGESSASGPPTINVWHGSTQSFGAIGAPQRWVNILGNVSDQNGVASLKYSLNDGPFIDLSQGGDTRRLWLPGDFNIDLPYAGLNPGSNTVRITAINGGGEESNTTVIVNNSSGSVWPMNYSVGWGSSTSLVDSAQVVDGKWGLVGGGIRPVELGYDRAVAIGDTTWDDYEVTARVTVHGIDSSAAAFGPVSDGPALGFLMRWKGHTDNPPFSPPITQPMSGYLPYGALGWYHWRNGFGNPLPNRWELVGDNLAVKTHSTSQPLEYGVSYYFKMRVRTMPGQGGFYEFKVWEVGQEEPSSWLLNGQESLSNPQRGSLVLLAHHVSATFGQVTVTRLSNDGTAPDISNIQSTSGVTSASITWITDEPATSKVIYGLTTTYGDTVSDGQRLVFAHNIQLAGLSSSTLYHYKVISGDESGNVASSGDYTFSTNTPPPPAAPTLLSPVNNATNQPINLTLRWMRSPTAASYRLQLSTDPNFAGNILVNDSTIVDTFRVVTGLAYNTIYYWRVNAKNAGGTSAFSAARRFTTSLPAPTLVSPPNNAISQPINNLTLRWNALAGATSYRLQLGIDSTFVSGLVKNDSTIADTFRVVNGLAMNTRYYWRVNGKNNGGSGPFSSTRIFTTTTQLPNQVVPVSPFDGEEVRADTVRLIWRQSQPDVTRYWLEYTIDSLFIFRAIDSALTDTSFVVRQLMNNKIYYWKVRAGNAGGWGPFSAVRRFSVHITGVEEDRALPRGFSLSQNYPNPFNPSTRIEFALPKESHVKLEVYTVLGEKVATLVDETKPAGYYTVQFNAAEFTGQAPHAAGPASGLYFYRMSTNEVSFTKKMLLLK